MSELLDAVGQVDDGLAACFVLKPLEVLLCREALFSLDLSTEAALWFVPDERRPAIQASIDALELLGLEVRRYKEVRARSGNLRSFREMVRLSRASRESGRLRAELSASGTGIRTVIAGHNVSAWGFAGNLDARSWIIVDSSRVTVDLGYLEAMASEGIAGVLGRSAERGKGLSPRMTRRIVKSAPGRTVFFSMYGASTGNVIKNSLPRLSNDYARLDLDTESALILLPERSSLTQDSLSVILEEFPHINRLLLKPHPRDTRAHALVEAPRSSERRLEVVALPAAVGVEEIPTRVGFLPGHVLAASPSTALSTMKLAAGDRISTHVVEFDAPRP